MPTRRAAVYARISQDRTGAGLGVERQEQDCRKLAATLGWAVTSVHVDNDVSAYSGKKRPGYRAMLADIEAGRVDAVLVWHTDRLHRSPVELEEYIALCDVRGVPTHTVQAGELDLTTPSGRMVARMLGAAARYEVEHKSARTKRSQKQAAEQGKWLGGARPWGYVLHDDGSAEIQPEQATELRNAVDQLLAGASLGSVVRDLNDRGVPTARGGRWNYTTLRQVISRPRNAGIITLNGQEIARSQWPAILDEDQWRAVVALLEDPERRKKHTHGNVAVHLLSGLALCGREGCGAPMRTASTRSGQSQKLMRMYRCTARDGEGGHASRRIEPLNEYVEAAVVARLQRLDGRRVAPRGAGAGKSADLHLQAEALRERLRDADRLFADMTIDAGRLTAITETVKAKLDAVTALIAGEVVATRPSVLDQADDPAALWQSWDVAAKRRVLPEILTVVVLPGGAGGHGFRPDLVDLRWATG